MANVRDAKGLAELAVVRRESTKAERRSIIVSVVCDEM